MRPALCPARDKHGTELRLHGFFLRSAKLFHDLSHGFFYCSMTPLTQQIISTSKLWSEYSMPFSMALTEFEHAS